MAIQLFCVAFIYFKKPSSLLHSPIPKIICLSSHPFFTPSLESSSPGPKSASKTPKLFKRFHRHRRWQSSSGVKLELEMIPPSTTHEDLLDPPLPDLKQPQPLATTTTSVVERLYLLPAREVAERLTQMDAHLLSCISPDEIRDGAWMKRGQKVSLNYIREHIF